MNNYLTVDLEEWFHIGEDFVPRARWEGLPSRVEENVDHLLLLLDRHRVRATFFVLGWVAERHPDLVRRVRDCGHPIASHGYSHQMAYRLSPAEFEEDLTRSGEILEEITGRRPAGYRAARWSLGRGALWAFPILVRQGITYDSSLAPCPFIGSPDFPREPHRTWEFMACFWEEAGPSGCSVSPFCSAPWKPSTHEGLRLFSTSILGNSIPILPACPSRR
ncbi:MAG: hypothetical protein DMH00_12190 [Acidobacteria bacterium]|nr:MAG: hypothetical protein DMH00_12190 [Acidobacteriota bacterium]